MIRNCILFALGILLLTVSTYCYAKIIKTHDYVILQQILEKSDADTLVILDVDDVILQQRDQILRSPYKPYLVEIEKELAVKYTPEEVLNLKSIVILAQQPELVDNRLLNTLANLQNRKVPVVALTFCATGKQGQIDSIEDWRTTQLNQLGVDFTKLNNFKNTTLPEIPAKFGTPTVKNGIIFTALAEKGIVLDAVLRKENVRPKKIIFVDDKLRNLQSVQTAALRKDISFIGIEYTTIKSNKVPAFNHKRSKIQLELLLKNGVWVSDQDALALAQSTIPDS